LAEANKIKEQNKGGEVERRKRKRREERKINKIFGPPAAVEHWTLDEIWTSDINKQAAHTKQVDGAFFAMKFAKGPK